MTLNKPQVGVSTMPVTHEKLSRAAAEISELLPPGYYGHVRLTWEGGRLVRALVEQSIKIT